MQKVILDTNVIVSALIQKSYPNFILNHCLQRKAVVCLSKALFFEYNEVLSRPKFSSFQEFRINAEFVLAHLLDISEFYTPKTKIDLISDEADNRILELARECGAHFIITGNIKDFKMEFFEKSQIITPKAYWERIF